MTFILMLLLLTLAVGLSLYSHLSLNQRSLHICQSELLRAQSRVGKNLDQLFVLNSEAMGLRAQKKAAELELAIAIAARNPLGVSQATIKLQKIRLAREALAATQNRLLLLSQQEIARAQTFTLAKVKEFFANENIRWHGHFSISLNSIFSLPITLAVKPDVVGDIAPVYETVEPFSAKQALQVSWKSSRSTESGMWTDILHNHTDRWEQKCTVTLKQNKEHFEPALVWDKFF